MQTISNPYQGSGLSLDAPQPSSDADTVAALLAQCPKHARTPLTIFPGLFGADFIAVKDERNRMGLGSFKALGAAYVIAHDATHAGGRLEGETYVTASAGNHGMSVAAGAAVFGAKSVIYISETVPEVFAQRLSAKGATVVREGEAYEASMAAAEKAASENGWRLLSDSSWPGYIDPPYRLMEGYLQMAREAAEDFDGTPTHVFLQAGVGGLAAAVATHCRNVWGDAPEIIVVEPEIAAALFESVKAGRLVEAPGPVSIMGRLDCKEPSLIALNGLSKDADTFALISEDESKAAMRELETAGLATTPSGGAGLAAARLWELPADARVLCILSEGPE